MKNLIRRIIKETVNKMEQFKDEYHQPYMTFNNTKEIMRMLERDIYKKYGFTNKKEYYITFKQGHLVVRLME
jgi:hypothetical protein